MTYSASPATAVVLTANGNSTSVTVPVVITANVGIGLNVTAVSGTTPSLTVSVQWSYDNVNFFSSSPADTFAAITAVGGAVQNFTIKAPYWRLAYAVTGTTPSFTLTASAYYAS